MRLSDDIVTLILGISAMFASVAGKSNGLFYLGMLLFGSYFLIRDKQLSLPFERSEDGRIQSLLIAIGGWAGYILLTPVLFAGLVFMTSEQLLVISQVLLPDLIASSPWFTVINAMIFGAIETLLIARVIDFSLSEFNSSLDFSAKSVVIYLATVLMFVAFHIFVKKTFDIPTGLNKGLIATFAFGILQVTLMVWQKQTREAVGMHVINNGIASAIKEGLITTTQVIQKFKII